MLSIQMEIINLMENTNPLPYLGISNSQKNTTVEFAEMHGWMDGWMDDHFGLNDVSNPYFVE